MEWDNVNNGECIGEINIGADNGNSPCSPKDGNKNGMGMKWIFLLSFVLFSVGITMYNDNNVSVGLMWFAILLSCWAWGVWLWGKGEK